MFIIYFFMTAPARVHTQRPKTQAGNVKTWNNAEALYHRDRLGNLVVLLDR
jgi:hypothetical protein